MENVAGRISQKNTRYTARFQNLHVMTINVHKGFSFFNRRHVLPELRDAVSTLSTDMVFLQEVIGVNRKHARRYHDWPEVPQYEYLADTMWPDFAYGRNAVYPDGDHGNALLSRFPIIHHKNWDVSISGTEQRGLLHCILELPERSKVHAICVHLGLRQSHRLEQLTLLCELLDSIQKNEPVIIAGDFNDWRQQATKILFECDVHEAFISHYGRPAKSFPARWPFLCLDRIYSRNACVRNPEALYRKPWSHLSDHVPLIAEVCL
ncbi:MAG TPA: endonuclease/exonuclease/phosphatase family protein [Halomonas sp.]|nr:endonuclease/exonuclease/phosphatase family protein [Halomonas sp.]